MLEIQKFARNPFYVDAVRITEDNMADVSLWCKGVIRSENDPAGGRREFVKVKVVRAINTEQTKAYIGDWVLYAGSGFKKYTDHAFNKSYTLVEDSTIDTLGYAQTETPTDTATYSSTADEQKAFAEQHELKAGGLTDVDPLIPFSTLQNDEIQEEEDLATEHLSPDEAQQELPFPEGTEEVQPEVSFSVVSDTGVTEREEAKPEKDKEKDKEEKVDEVPPVEAEPVVEGL